MIPGVMLRSLQLVGFKSFRKARISFGPFTLLVGTNASGAMSLGAEVESLRRIR